MKKRVAGARKIVERMQALELFMARRAYEECYKAGERTRSQVVADIAEQKGVPDDAKSSKRHYPAPPGGPPNADTGRLMGSYSVASKRPDQRGDIAVRVVAGVRYAYWLEYGTVKMLPRPHLIPRFRENAQKLRVALAAIPAEFARSTQKGPRRK